ncbi:unnamed protein product [Amoebophrya sp. A120]|nr:unnamed protein product [Amoebophrya sp. A120]|eukprot:GSA120T00013188001.1
MPSASAYKDLFEGGLSGYIVLGTQPEEADPGYVQAYQELPTAQSVSGKRATCTTPTDNRIEDEITEGPGNDDYLIKRKNFVWSPKQCAHLCDQIGDECSHWSLSLGPVWNSEQIPGGLSGGKIAKPLPFTPKAGAPGHCFLCGIGKNSPVQQFYKDSMLVDAPGMYSYVGVKRKFTTAEPRNKELFSQKPDGPLFERNWSYLPPKWLRYF